MAHTPGAPGRSPYGPMVTVGTPGCTAGTGGREIAAHYGIDPDDAPDLYGTRLCAYAVGRDARA